jgi:hypothetical protein
LSSCTSYNYKVVSGNSAGAVTSTAASFTTSGCVADAPIVSQIADTVATSTGGVVAHTEGSSSVNIDVPVGFTTASESVDVQVKAFDTEIVIASIGKPSANLSPVGNVVFDLKAVVSSGGTITTFDHPLTITMQYSTADVDGLDESTFRIYHYHNAAWEPLTGCTVNAIAKTVSCTTTSFSTFSIFGSTRSTGTSGGNHASGSSSGLVMAPIVNSPSTTATPPLKNNGSLPFQPAPPAFIGPPVPILSRYVFKRTLQVGSVGADVKQLQLFLNAHGFIVAKKGPGSPGKETAFFGSATKNAVKLFQEAHAADILIPAGFKKGTGMLGPVTITFIMSLQ